MTALPKPDLLELAARTPVVVTSNGRVYHVTVDPTPGRALTFGARRYGLLPGDTLHSVEQRYRGLERTAIGLEGTRHLLAAGLVDEVLSARASFEDALRYARAAIVPRLEALASPETRSPRPAPAATPTPKRTAPAWAHCSFLRELAGTLLIAGRAFPLAPASDDGRAEIVVTLGPERLAPTAESSSLDELWERSVALIDADIALRVERIASSTVPRNPAWPLAATRPPNSPLVGPGRSVVFENRIGGVIVDHGNVVIFVHVPTFGVLHLDGFTYVFPAVQVSVVPAVTPNGGTISTPTVAHVMDAYDHPFVSQSGSVCMVQPSGYFEELNRMDAADATLRLLLDARHTLMFGFRRDSVPYRLLETFTLNRLPHGVAPAPGVPVFDVRHSTDDGGVQA